MAGGPGILAVALGLAALAFRPVSPVAPLVTALVGVIGVAVPLPARARQGRRGARTGIWVLAVVLGVGAFAMVRAMGAAVPVRYGGAAFAASSLAAVAEEAFFRRLVYGRLERWGPAVAVAGSAVLFGAVHVGAYGAAVLPIDVAAGILLGWQRWVTGGWSAPALTHVAANLLAMG